VDTDIVTPQDQAPILKVNIFYRLVSHVIIGQKDYVIIRAESLDAKGQVILFLYM
jgi:hypothetical protein